MEHGQVTAHNGYDQDFDRFLEEEVKRNQDRNQEFAGNCLSLLETYINANRYRYDLPEVILKPGYPGYDTYMCRSNVYTVPLNIIKNIIEHGSDLRIREEDRDRLSKKLQKIFSFKYGKPRTEEEMRILKEVIEDAVLVLRTSLTGKTRFAGQAVM